MPRKSREDEPGSIHHIFDRGLAKRTIFENRADVRYFLSRLAREHRRGRLLTHSYVVLANHFHLVVESPLGQASEAMRVILNEYVRRFNRLRSRDGPLFRGRFGSRRIKSESYWWTLLRYIDLHPEKARIAARAGVYPFGSANHYLQRKGPRWLTRGRVEDLLTQGLCDYRPSCYERLLQRPLAVAERELVRLRMSGARNGEDPLDLLLSAGPSRVREWMIDQAAMADGTRPGLAVVAPSQVIARIDASRRTRPDWYVHSGRQRRDLWPLALAGLLRDACCLSLPEVAARLGIAVSTAHARVAAHRDLMNRSEEYGSETAVIIADSLADFAAAAPFGRQELTRVGVGGPSDPKELP